MLLPEPDWWILGWTLHLIVFVLVCHHCLLHRREPASTLIWIFLAWSLPVAGALLYLGFGVDRVPTKGWRKQVHDQAFLEARRAREQEELPLAYWRAMYDKVQADPPDPRGHGLDRLLDSILPDFPMLGGNRIRPLVDASETVPAMLDAIRGARRHIHLQTFILGGDCGRTVMDALAERARAGVRVRVLFDRFGSTRSLWNGFFKPYRGILNLELVGWTQANPLKRQFQINLRNHRKILVADGERAFCGGVNLHDQQTPDGQIRDYHFEVLGPAVLELQYSFLRDWNFMTDEGPERLLQAEYFPHLPAAGGTVVRLVSSGPTAESEAFCDVVFSAVTSAEKQVLLATPYFIPNRDLLRALRAAALRGVDVHLIVPQRNNHFYAGLAGEALYEEMLDAGVRVFLRQPPFMHAKALIVDDFFSLVGTANLDMRSLRLNYETGLAVFDESFADDLKEVVLADEQASVPLELDVWRRRPLWHRFAENTASLFTPVL
jgi:cardiolipin synthase